MAKPQVSRELPGSKLEDSVGTTHVPRVLIVEDNLSYALQLMKALKDNKLPPTGIRFDVDVAPDEVTALDLINTGEIDIFIVDLKLGNQADTADQDEEIGKRLVTKILQTSEAGVIVHSSIPAGETAVTLLSLGADDYIAKPTSPQLIKAKVLSLWRRVELTRPSSASSFAHTSRVFFIGEWRFTVGSRELRNSRDEVIRISPTEHAFLRYLCAIEDHLIDRETFNVSILGRPSSEKDRRFDNFIYRIRSKLGPSVKLLTKREGVYELAEVQEIGPSPVQSRSR